MTTQLPNGYEAVKVPEHDFDDVDETCPRCKCCDTYTEDCDYCGGKGGRDGEELMEDDPLWYSPDDFEFCDVCNGRGYFVMCLGDCDENGKHNHTPSSPPSISNHTQL